MKRALFLFLLISFASLAAQDTANITVKGHEVNNGVVIVSAQTVAEETSAEAPVKGHFDLQCNKGMPDCNIPAAGDYVLVRLPKNWGMYDCSNVDLYPAGSDPKAATKVGEYCLLTK